MNNRCLRNSDLKKLNPPNCLFSPPHCKFFEVGDHAIFIFASLILNTVPGIWQMPSEMFIEVNDTRIIRQDPGAGV